MEAIFYTEGDVLEITPAAALAAGEITVLADGTVAVATGAIAISTKGNVRRTGLFRVTAATGTTFSVGDYVYWDDSASLAIAAPAESADVYLGVARKAKVSGELEVLVDFNAAPAGGGGTLLVSPAVVVDTETGVQTAAQNIIPASWNQTGLVLLAAYSLVTEVFGGASQDQGIVTVEDSDGNDLCTLTPSDGGADALNDVIVGTSDIPSATTGDAAKVVAAGKGVQALVSQATSGASAAGKQKVWALFLRQ